MIKYSSTPVSAPSPSYLGYSSNGDVRHFSPLGAWLPGAPFRPDNVITAGAENKRYVMGVRMPQAGNVGAFGWLSDTVHATNIAMKVFRATYDQGRVVLGTQVATTAIADIQNNSGGFRFNLPIPVAEGEWIAFCPYYTGANATGFTFVTRQDMDPPLVALAGISLDASAGDGNGAVTHWFGTPACSLAYVANGAAQIAPASNPVTAWYGPSWAMGNANQTQFNTVVYRDATTATMRGWEMTPPRTSVIHAVEVPVVSNAAADRSALDMRVYVYEVAAAGDYTLVAKSHANNYPYTTQNLRMFRFAFDDVVLRQGVRYAILFGVDNLAGSSTVGFHTGGASTSASAGLGVSSSVFAANGNPGAPHPSMFKGGWAPWPVQFTAAGLVPSTVRRTYMATGAGAAVPPYMNFIYSVIG